MFPYIYIKAIPTISLQIIWKKDTCSVFNMRAKRNDLTYSLRLYFNTEVHFLFALQ